MQDETDRPLPRLTVDFTGVSDDPDAVYRLPDVLSEAALVEDTLRYAEDFDGIDLSGCSRPALELALNTFALEDDVERVAFLCRKEWGISSDIKENVLDGLLAKGHDALLETEEDETPWFPAEVLSFIGAHLLEEDGIQVTGTAPLADALEKLNHTTTWRDDGMLKIFPWTAPEEFRSWQEIDLVSKWAAALGQFVPGLFYRRHAETRREQDEEAARQALKQRREKAAGSRHGPH